MNVICLDFLDIYIQLIANSEIYEILSCSTWTPFMNLDSHLHACSLIQLKQ